MRRVWATGCLMIASFGLLGCDSGTGTTEDGGHKFSAEDKKKIESQPAPSSEQMMEQMKKGGDPTKAKAK